MGNHRGAGREAGALHFQICDMEAMMDKVLLVGILAYVVILFGIMVHVCLLYGTLVYAVMFIPFGILAYGIALLVRAYLNILEVR